MKKKISSENGATILLALLFFVLCAVVGSIVLAAGSAASGRVAGLSEQEQSFYTVTSAAQVLRDEMTGAMTLTNVNGEITASSVSPKTDMEDYLQRAAISVKGSNEVFNDKFTITTEKDVNKAKFPEVTAEFTMGIGYDIRVVLYQTNDDKTYICSIKINNISSAEDSSERTVINWDKGKIHKGR